MFFSCIRLAEDDFFETANSEFTRASAMHNASNEISHNFHDTDLATLADTATLAATLRGALFYIIKPLLNSFK